MKKYIGIGMIALLLAGAVWWSISMGSAKEDSSASAGTAQTGEAGVAADAPQEDGMSVNAPVTDYYAAFREEREQTRALEISYLDEIISTSANDSETLEDAQAQKLALVEQMEMEFNAESMILAKGFSDAAVTISRGTVNVAVDCEELTAEEAAQILEIVRSATGATAENVKITANPK